MRMLDQILDAVGSLHYFGNAFTAGFLIAVAEAFVLSTLIVPGTLMTFSMGVLIAYGRIHAAGCVIGVFLGMAAGDQASFWLARHCGSWLSRSKLGKKFLEPINGVRTSPVRTLLLSHLCPYLSGLAPASAGLASIPYARFTVYDGLGALLGTSWFLGLGATIGKTAQAFAKGMITGVGLMVLGVIASIVLLRVARGSYRRRGGAFIVAGVFEYPVFLMQGLSYRFTSRQKKRELLRQLQHIALQAEPGDILIVTRDAPGLWGKATHVVICEGAGYGIHAFHVVRRQRLLELPLRDGFRLLRVVSLTTEQKRTVLEYAANQIGKAFRIATTLQHVRRGEPKHFSCVMLAWRSFLEAGIDLAAHIKIRKRWIFPRDLQSSPLTVEIKVETSANSLPLA